MVEYQAGGMVKTVVSVTLASVTSFAVDTMVLERAMFRKTHGTVKEGLCKGCFYSQTFWENSEGFLW